MWGRLLDHGRAERLHVPEAEYPQHMITPIQPNGSARWRGDGVAAPGACSSAEVLTADLEDAGRGRAAIWITLAHMSVRHQFGSDVDWHIQFFDGHSNRPSASTSSRSFATWPTAYGNRRSERTPTRGPADCGRGIGNVPCPTTGITGPWRTLEVGSRPWRVWLDVVGHLGQTAPFDAATHAMLARSRLEHMRYLTRLLRRPQQLVPGRGVRAGGGRALFAGIDPGRRAYLRIAMRRLKWKIKQLRLLRRRTSRRAASALTSSPPPRSPWWCGRAQAGASPARWGTSSGLVEKRTRCTSMPAAEPPAPHVQRLRLSPVDPVPVQRVAAEMFPPRRSPRAAGGAAAHGREGRAPGPHLASMAFGGVLCDARPMGRRRPVPLLRRRAWGASHQHEDKLTFTLYAGGRLLIGDPEHLLATRRPS